MAAVKIAAFLLGASTVFAWIQAKENLSQRKAAKN